MSCLASSMVSTYRSLVDTILASRPASIKLGWPDAYDLLSPYVAQMKTLETHEDHAVAAWAKAARERIKSESSMTELWNARRSKHFECPYVC